MTMTLRLQKWFTWRCTGCLSFVPPDPSPTSSALHGAPEGTCPTGLFTLQLWLGGVWPMGRTERRSEKRKRGGGIHSPGSPALGPRGLAVSLTEGLAPSGPPRAVPGGAPSLHGSCRSLTSSLQLCKWSPYKTPLRLPCWSAPSLPTGAPIHPISPGY